MLTASKSVLGLDVGGKRIGVAIASLVARLARPLVTLENNEDFFDALRDIVKTEEAGAFVVGLPRGLEGQQTAQTDAVEDFVRTLREQIKLPVHMQDEALTSKYAEAELHARGKPYEHGDVDSLAATYILQDWLAEHGEPEA